MLKTVFKYSIDEFEIFIMVIKLNTFNKSEFKKFTML